ncbi:MAG: HemK2/MTQ2 family protein methyltransferase [Candidatus Altiarchaeota archaeon]|nr:HemK2/MTQ2 family protein methyltransferase [Candidatus Altiarchaeota archaeon]
MHYHGDYKIKTSGQVYKPAEDSILLAENQLVSEGDTVLDMGTGTGLQAIIASDTASSVLAVDVNPMALKLAKENAGLNNRRNIEFRESDLFRNLKKKEKFNLIMFNPPYLPVDGKNMLDRAWSGGVGGREVIDEFICEFKAYLKPKGGMQMVVSSLNNPCGVLDALRKIGFGVELTAEKKIAFEKLLLLSCFKHRNK